MIKIKKFVKWEKWGNVRQVSGQGKYDNSDSYSFGKGEGKRS